MTAQKPGLAFLPQNILEFAGRNRRSLAGGQKQARLRAGNTLDQANAIECIVKGFGLEQQESLQVIDYRIFDTDTYDFGKSWIEPSICTNYFKFDQYSLEVEGVLPEDLGLSITNSGLLKISSEDPELRYTNHTVLLNAAINNPE